MSGSVVVPVIKDGMNMFTWKDSETKKLGVGQNRVARITYNAPRFAAVEAHRDDTGRSTFGDRLVKATLRYKVSKWRMQD